MLTQLITWLKDWVASSRTSYQLYKLSERELRDMGINKSDIPGISNGTYVR